MKGLVLSGGHGTRLRPLTHSQQKQLIPVANKPVLFYAIEDLLEAGVREVGVVTGPNRHQVEDAVRAHQWPEDATITFIHQGEPKGLAHALQVAGDFLDGDPVIMYLGDNLLKGGVRKHVEAFHGSDAAASILLTPVDRPQMFGVADLGRDGRVRRLVEKPDDPPSNLALVGIYLFQPAIHDAVASIAPSDRGELEITDAIQWLIDQGHAVDAARVEGWWKDTGLPQDVLAANALVLDDVHTAIHGELEKTVSLKGRVRVGEGATIRGKTTIKGPVVIGRDAIIEDAYIGPYTSIGNGCTVRRTEVADSILMDECTLEDAGVVVESLMGRGVTARRSASRPRGHRLIVGDHSHISL